MSIAGKPESEQVGRHFTNGNCHFDLSDFVPSFVGGSICGFEPHTDAARVQICVSITSFSFDVPDGVHREEAKHGLDAVSSLVYLAVHVVVKEILRSVAVLTKER